MRAVGNGSFLFRKKYSSCYGINEDLKGEKGAWMR
nr:MAG TPA: hypothetical protein [Caudoviricetes sp.]